MAAEAGTLKKSKSYVPKNRAKRKRTQLQDSKIERLDSLPWNASVRVDEPFSLAIGSNELEGGFLSLEEIEEVDYGLLFPGSEEGDYTKQGSNKREILTKEKADSVLKHENEVDAVADGKLEGNGDLDPDDKKTTKKKRKKSKKKKEAGEVSKCEESASVTESKDVDDEVSVDEADYHAWAEYRLHPLIMKSLYRLGFKEPTPIQKACIPAAAHQGKDVIGAAETGSGKTLAFGLPILQRFLEEREKEERMIDEKGKDSERYAPTSVLRALIITPTRELALQVTDHLKAVAKGVNVRVVPIVGGILTEKQERLLKSRPEIVVGTPGRLWELMSGGEKHLVELHSLSFFVLDEADRMIENGHFQELQSIIDMLPMSSGSVQLSSQNTESCVNLLRKKRQTFVFSATIALSADFRKKLKRGSLKAKQSTNDGLNSIETLSERAGMRENAAIIDLTNASILANKLEESFIECSEEDKDAYLYYLLTVHGEGRTIVFCTSIAALRHITSLFRILGVNASALHAQMQQRARLKAMDRFRGTASGILFATDVAARGLDIPGVRTVIHYQLPHSAEVYVHRSGRTARASSDGCSIALISSSDKLKFASLCKSFAKDGFRRFPLENSFMPEILQRLSLARQIDKMKQKESKESASKSWYERSAESLGLVIDNDDSEDEKVNKYKQSRAGSMKLKKLQQELDILLSRPLQSKTFSHLYLAGAGVSPLIQQQLDELARQKQNNGDSGLGENKRRKLVVIGRDCVEPLQALRTGGEEVHIDVMGTHVKRRNVENLRNMRKQEKTRLRDLRRKKRKQLKGKE